LAGILKVDRIQSDSNLAFSIAGSNVAFMNATSLQMAGSNVSLAGTNVFTSGKLVTAAQPTGAVLQVVQGTYSTQVTNATQTNADSGLTATITPSSATSKILCIVNMAGLYNGGNNGLGLQLQLIRGATNIIQFARYTNYISSALGLLTNAGTNYLDSPETTSATTYKVQFCRADGTAGTISVQQNSDTSTITLMEIAA
jgi:hypothetical protein